MKDSVQERDVLRLERSWYGMEYHFNVWKVKDAASLEHELVRIGIAMESSMLSVSADGRLSLEHRPRGGTKRDSRSTSARSRAFGKLFTLSGKERSTSSTS